MSRLAHRQKRSHRAALQLLSFPCSFSTVYYKENARITWIAIAAGSSLMTSALIALMLHAQVR